MTLARWVPRLLRERLATAQQRRTGGSPETLDVATLWLDISGFTPLTRRFAEQGVRGAEIVSGILDRCYGAVTDRIIATGGDIVDFAGDGILAVWTAAESGSLASAVRRAHGCAREIQATMDRFPAAEGAELRFYAGIGAGRVTLLEVGGVDGSWRLLVAGEPLAQMGTAKALCAAGGVVLSPEAEALLDTVELPAPVPFAGPAELTGADALLRPYLVQEVLRRIDAGQTAWLAEFRVASVLFAIVPEPGVDSDSGRQRMADAVRRAQELVGDLGGSLNQVMMDDTGLVLLAAWGVPGHTHEDDARRAVQAATAIRAGFDAAGLEPRVGVASGRIFCGAVGSAARCRYALVGSAVNRAARVAMASPHAARCDRRTRDLADRWVGFGSAETLALKGIDQPVEVYTATRVKEQTVAAAPDETPVSGRERERRVIADALAGSVGDGPPPLLIEGEAGIGKSVLLRHVADEARALGRLLLVGAADAVERSTPYFPWRAPFRALLAVDGAGDPAAERARVEAALQPLSGREDRIPLLEPLLALGFTDTPTTTAMSGSDRGLATQELLAEILDLLGGPGPVIVLDDLHWFDSASLALILAIRERVPRVLLAAASRPLDDSAAPQLRAILARRDAVRIPLVEMSGAEVLGMVRTSLGVDEMPDALATFLIQRGEGHPLFTIELALLLREMDVVRVDGRRCAFDPDDSRLAALSFSAKAEGVVATRIDRLDPPHQLALKVASVIGRAFEYSLVERVYPIETQRSALRRILSDLTRPRLIEEERPDPALAYLFRHVVIREVAYNLVSFAQRRALHGDVARALEGSTEVERAGNLPLLAHHWLMAEAPGPAISYLERAGVEALRRGAGREAFRFLQDALALAERERSQLPDLTPSRLAEIERLTGEAMEQQLDVPESSRWLARALARLGRVVLPPGSAHRRRSLLREVMIQFGHIVWPQSWRTRPSGERAAMLEVAARAYGTLAEHAYFESDLIGTLLFSLQSVNLAEQARTPVAAERSYVTLAHTAGLAGITPLLNRYRRLSANTTQGRNMAFREIELAGRMLARGQFAEAAAAGERAAVLARRYADRHHEAQGWGSVASAMLRQGWPARVLDPAARIYPTGRTDWAMAVECMASILSGSPQGILERYAAMESWEPAFALSHKTIRAIWAEECSDWTGMRTHVEAALADLEGPGIKNAYTTGHYSNLLALHSRWYHRARKARSAELQHVVANIRRLRTALVRHTRTVAISIPRRELAGAMIAFHDGRYRAGMRHLARAQRESVRLDMAAEQVAALLEAARWELPGSDAGLERAKSICRERGMNRLLAEVEAAAR